MRLEGQVLDGAGGPVPDAVLEISTGEFLSVAVFARGLLRHLNTRVYLPGHENEIPDAVEAARRRTLVATRDGDVLRFDVHLQGKGETVFFE